jgi:hypothetical protein
MDTIDQLDSDESFAFSKGGISPEDMQALQEVVSEMRVSAMQAREADDPESPEEPIGAVEEEKKEETATPKEVEGTGEVPAEETEEEEEEEQAGEEPEEFQQEAEAATAEDSNDEEAEEEEDPRQQIRSISQDPKYSFVEDNMDESDMATLQELMSQMHAAVMEEVEQQAGQQTDESQFMDAAGQAKETSEAAVSGNEQEDSNNNGPETDSVQTEGDQDDIDEQEDSGDDDEWFSPSDTINAVDEQSKYAFRKGPITPEDLDTLQELISQMETRAMEEMFQDPHPLSYLPDESGINNPEMTKVSAQGMNSNQMRGDVTPSADSREFKTTEKPIVTTDAKNDEIITTSATPGPKKQTTHEPVSTTDSDEPKLNADGSTAQKGRQGGELFFFCCFLFVLR